MGASADANELAFVTCLDAMSEYVQKQQELASLLKEGWFELARARYSGSATGAVDNLHHAKHLRATTTIAKCSSSGGSNPPFQIAVLDGQHQQQRPPVAKSAAAPAGSSSSNAGDGWLDESSARVGEMQQVNKRTAGAQAVGSGSSRGGMARGEGEGATAAVKVAGGEAGGNKGTGAGGAGDGAAAGTGGTVAAGTGGAVAAGPSIENNHGGSGSLSHGGSNDNGGSSFIEELATKFGCDAQLDSSGSSLGDSDEDEDEAERRRAQTAVMLASPHLRAAKAKFMEAIRVATDLANLACGMKSSAAGYQASSA